MRTILFTFIFLFSINGLAQEFDYLNDIKLKKPEDFTQNEKEFIKALNFLMKTPYGKYSVDAQTCSDFIWKYVKKTPHLTVHVQGPIIVMDKKQTLFRMYVGLWARSVMKNPDKTEKEHNLFCYKNLGKYCSINKERISIRGYLELAEAYENDEVEEWLKKFE